MNEDFTEEEMKELMNGAFQAKVWMDVNRAFMKMSEEEQESLLFQFEYIETTFGADSEEMSNFFDSSCMKYSKLYYFVNTAMPNVDWDGAFEKELTE